jgi:hypothetical protein
MQSKFRLVVVSVVLTWLALMIGPASAQEAPTSPEVGVCQPGAGYASGCDVDQDGDIDIFDNQRTVLPELDRKDDGAPSLPGHPAGEATTFMRRTSCLSF